MNATPRRILFAALFAALPASAFAQGRGHGGGPPPGHGGVPPGQGGVPPGQQGRGGPPGQGNQRFAAQETQMIQGWVVANPAYVARPLPPGQMRQLARGRPLPPGLQRQALPPTLIAQLPPRPGYEYVAIGTSIALIAIGTGVVADILSGALAR